MTEPQKDPAAPQAEAAPAPAPKRLTVAGVKAHLNELYTVKIQQQMEYLELLYGPINEDDLQEILAELVARHEAYAAQLNKDMYHMMDIPCQKRLRFARADLLDIAKLEEHFKPLYQKPDFKDFTFSNNFLGKQHVFQFLDAEHIKAADKVKNALMEFDQKWIIEGEHTGSEVLLLSYNEGLKTVYAFCADKQVRLFDDQGNAKGLASTPEKVVCADFIENKALIGLDSGLVQIANSDMFVPIAYQEFFSTTPLECFFLTKESILVSFEGNRTLLIDTAKFVGWKKDFFDTRVLAVTRAENAPDLAFTITDNKFFNICKVEGDALRVRFKMKCLPFDKRCLHVVQADKKAYVASRNILIVFSLEDFIIMKKIELETHIQTPFVVSNVAFLKEFIVAVKLISQEVVLVNYTMNKKAGYIKLPNKAHQLGDMLSIDARLWIAWKSTVNSFKEVALPEPEPPAETQPDQPLPPAS